MTTIHGYEEIDFRPNPDPGWRVVGYWIEDTGEMHREEYPLAGWLIQQWSGPDGSRRVVPAYWSPGDRCLVALNDEAMTSANERHYLIREGDSWPTEATVRQDIEHQQELERRERERRKAAP